MGKITVNSISKKYESLYKEYSNLITAEESFYAINNAMIFAYFLQYIEDEYTVENQQECYKKIVERFGTEVFFHNIKKSDKYIECRNQAIKVFVDLFENTDGIPLERVLGNVLEKHINRKDTGSYYTPDDTTKYISQRTIFIALVKKVNKEIQGKIFGEMGIKTPSDILNYKGDLDSVLSRIDFNNNEKKEIIDWLYSLKIIDPTCGSGAFIVAAFECLRNIVNQLGEFENRINIFKSIYGLDISKEAVQLTRLRMLMRLVSEECDANEFSRIFSINFKVADAIKGSDYVIEEEGFDWKSFGVQFDCVIGNPPYVEASGYASDNYFCSKCGNLYAYIIERACNIATTDGMVSFIVPLPLVATPRMQTAKKYLESCSDNVFYGTYADRPGCIFTGVHQRLVIFFAEMGNSDRCNVYSSGYNYWYNDEREKLFESVSYYPNPHSGLLPKVGNAVEDNIYRKLISGNSSLINLWNTDETDYKLYLSTRIGFWIKAFDKNVFSSKEFKCLNAKNEEGFYLSLAILNSSVFYFLWVITSDCWHITNKNIEDFKFDVEKTENLNMDIIRNLVDNLMKDLEKNKKYIGSKQTEYEYKHKFSKSIIDQIDDAIAPIWGFSFTETEYIKNYTLKYRINNMEA